MSPGKKVLVVAPHMDDEVLGMGGTIARHVAAGDEVCVCIVAHRIYNGVFDEKANRREMEHAIAAKDVLGYAGVRFLGLNDERLDAAVQDIIKPLERYVDEVRPDILYSNFYGDNNQDHRAVFQAVRVVARPFAGTPVRTWYLYEAPSSTDQSPPVPEAAFQPDHYVNVEDVFAKKLEAFRCYETEGRDFPHPRSARALDVLAMKRGSEIGFPRAEAFMTLRTVWK